MRWLSKQHEEASVFQAVTWTEVSHHISGIALRMHDNPLLCGESVSSLWR